MRPTHPCCALRVLAAFLALAGCERRTPPQLDEYEELEPAVEIFEETKPPSPDEPPPPALGDSPNAVRARVRQRQPPPVLPTHLDERGDEPVRVRRYVYRVWMVVPAGLGDGRDRIARPSAELFVDVSHDRLRARFSGAGWPLPAGTEVRLRSDRHGVYVFDGEGGRPLPPGGLAEWFEGGSVTRRGPPLRVFRSFGSARQARADDAIPGALVCALLAELAGEPRDNVMRRCEDGAPHLFRLGFWRAEQTADVPVTLPQSALRADHNDPPPPVPRESGRPILESSGLRRISPSRPPPTEPSDERGLTLVNRSATRLIITIEGVVAGWVDAGARVVLHGLRPGIYEVGAIRPLGAVVQRRRAMAVPGTYSICDGRCREER